MPNGPILDKRHWLFDDFEQRMTTEEWKQMLLDYRDHIIYKGCVRKLIAQNLGYGVVSISKENVYE